MKRKIIMRGREVGLTLGRLARGCDLCFEGSKIVVFVTGLCDDGCFYCPVSGERMGRDVVFVDEEPVNNMPADIVEEAYRIEAKGASITGGDPLLRPHRTASIIQALKAEFGSGFHIHLYTSGRYATRMVLEELEAAGLDEIRFHPTLPWLTERIRLALEYTSMSVGAEVPVIPGYLQALKKLALFLEEIKADFLNLNELEVSESNQEALTLRGFKPRRDGRSIEGSRETAFKLLEWAQHNVRKLNIRFCPAIYKDSVQTRNRLRRKAKNEARLYEAYTPEGTIIRAEISFPEKNRGIAEQLAYNGAGIIDGEVFVTHPLIARSIQEELGGDARIAEYHPTASRLLVSSMPLGSRYGVKDRK